MKTMPDYDFRAAVGCAVFGTVYLVLALVALYKCRGRGPALFCIVCASFFSYVTASAIKDAFRERPAPVAPTEVKQ